MRKNTNLLIFLLILFLPFSNSFAWDCKTHAYIAKKAGIRIPEAACLPDIIRDENPSLLAPFHYHNASPDTVVTPEYINKYTVKEEIITIDGRTINIFVPHEAGILYWEIINIYEKMKSLDMTKPDNQLAYEYYIASIAHYIGDLSQPLHNFPYGSSPASDGKVYLKEGEFNKEEHIKFDEAFSFYLSSDPEINQKIDNALNTVNIKSKDDLKKEIAKIANSAIKIANSCYKEKRLPSKEELIRQIASSISLIKAINKSR